MVEYLCKECKDCFFVKKQDLLGERNYCENCSFLKKKLEEEKMIIR